MKKYFMDPVITPENMLAGDSYAITISMKAATAFNAGGSAILYDMPATLGFSRPSLYDQEDNGYVAVFCSNPDITYKKYVWDMESGAYAGQGKDSFRGMAQRIFAIEILDGYFREGDEITIVWGYTRNGFGIGTKVSSIVPVLDFRPLINIRYFADRSKAFPDYGRSFKGFKRPTPDEEHELSIRIHQREPESIRVFHQIGKTSIAVYDRFFNVCPVSDITEYVNEYHEGTFNSHGLYVMPKENLHFTSKKLPLTETPDMKNAYEGYNIYFGDLHSHSSVSNDCTEREKLPIDAKASMRFAKEAACLDFHAVTDHHQPWDIQRNRIQKENWEALGKAVEEMSDEAFVSFNGFEFRSPRGDTAVILNGWVPYEKIDTDDLKEIDDVWKRLEDTDIISIPHFHNYGKLKENEWIGGDPKVEPVIEVYSCHGSYETPDAQERGTPIGKRRRADRNAQFYLKNGYKYGLVCNSDGHKGNPGHNGLTAILAKELTPDAIFEALRARRVYGTTNARIKLIFTMNGHLMGEVLKDDEKKLMHIALEGENNWKAVDVIYNGEIIRRYRPEDKTFTFEEDLGRYGKGFYYVRATQIDNHIAYSSPIWFE